MERRLYRVEGGNAVVGGVASGLADYFGIDVAIVRLLFVLGFFSPIPVGIAYIILWIALPRVSGQSQFAQYVNADSASPFGTASGSTDRKMGGQLAGIILVVLGVIFLADEFISWFDFGKLWPVLLIGAGVYILFNKKTEPVAKEPELESNDSSTIDNTYNSNL